MGSSQGTPNLVAELSLVVPTPPCVETSLAPGPFSPTLDTPGLLRPQRSWRSGSGGLERESVRSSSGVTLGGQGTGWCNKAGWGTLGRAGQEQGSHRFQQASRQPQSQGCCPSSTQGARSIEPSCSAPLRKALRRSLIQETTGGLRAGVQLRQPDRLLTGPWTAPCAGTVPVTRGAGDRLRLPPDPPAPGHLLLQRWPQRPWLGPCLDVAPRQGEATSPAS